MNVKHFFQNMMKYCIPSVVTAILSIAVIPIVSRVFPTDDYGKINMFYTVGNMALYIVMMGLDSAYIRFYFEEFKGINRKDIFSLTFWLSSVFICITTIFIFIFIKDIVTIYLFGEVKGYLLLLLAIYIFSLMLFRMLSIETRMEEKCLLYNIQQIVLIIINRVSYVLAVFVTTNYQFAIIIITVSTLMFAVIFLFKQKKIQELRIPNVSREALKGILAFSIPLMPTTVMIWLNNSAAKMVLSGYGDFCSLGIVSMATGLANVFSLIPSAFCVYWSPFMYKNYKDEQAFIKKVHNYIMLISILMVLGFYSLQDVLYLIIGSEYKASQSYFMLIMLSAIQSLISETTSYGIILEKKTKVNLYISIIALLINVLTGYLLYPIMKSFGVVLGISLSALFQLVIKTIIGQKYYVSIVSKWQTILGYILIIIIITSNVWFYDEFIVRIILSITILCITLVLYKNDVVVIFKKLSTIKYKNKG
ncbi:MAG: oligosaccharide flippase family protein [Lachnospiraceae bacterium]|nr:oligosaccharide flippase family protein [Lachnospiraceae bacterium]